MTVDTLAKAKELEAAGMDQRQAEAVSRVMGRLADDDEHVTRTYLDARMAELRAEIFRLQLGAVAIIVAATALLRFWP